MFPRMHYELSDLKIFLAVAEEGNLSRGAERSHLAASSVSLRIKGLEGAIGTSLGLNVVAEGVETEAQRAFLSGLGCHAYQGYLFGYPMSAGSFDAYFARERKKPDAAL